MRTDTPSRLVNTPLFSAAIMASPRLDASGSRHSVIGRAKASVIIWSQIGDLSSAPPDAIRDVGAANGRVSSVYICLNRNDTLSRHACRISTDVVERLIPVIIARSSGRQ